MDYVVYCAKKMRTAAPVILAGLALVSLSCGLATAQPRSSQPAPLRTVTVASIPGVVAPDAMWTTVWQGTDNADGLIADTDGSLLFAQEQPSRVMRLGTDGRLSVVVTGTNGTGALGRDPRGRLIGAQRSCTDPGGAPESCTRPTAVAVLLPDQAVLADQADGRPFGRLNDLVVDQLGGVYVTVGAAHYVAADGRVTVVAGDVSSNGVALSPDETALYLTNGQEILVFRRDREGMTGDRRTFARLSAGTGDGMAVDREGRLYVTCQQGVEVFSAIGERLGLIPTPRNAISIVFAGPDRRDLFVVGSGALTPEGTEWQTPPGVRNNGKSIFRLRMLSQGLPIRAR
jgi:sugar lactone lactonase YvrE